MSKDSECLMQCLNLAEKQGYLTFDNILDIADSFDLSVSDVDVLSDAIQTRGIIVYESEPTNTDEEDYDDYSQIDYDAVFREVVQVLPTIADFIEKVKQFKPIQYGEMTSLLAQANEGNEHAIDRLFQGHARIVIKTALNMSKQYDYDLEIAISSGFEGLITAINRFDLSGYGAFQSYASLWIMQKINKECSPNWMKVYFPLHMKKKLMPLYDYLLQNEDLYDSMITEQLVSEVSLKFDIDENEALANLSFVKNQVLNYYSLDDPEVQDEIQSFIYEEETATKSSLKSDIYKALSCLREKERMVLSSRYGIVDGLPHTLEEIGKSMGVTRERIRQIEAEALRRLKKAMQTKF